MTRKFRYDATKDEVVEVIEGEKLPVFSRAWEKEFHSEALAENPKNLKWLKEEDQRLGVGDTNYDESGRPVFTSKRKWEAYKKAHGYYDRGTVRGKRLTNEVDATILKRLIERFSSKE